MHFNVGTAIQSQDIILISPFPLGNFPNAPLFGIGRRGNEDRCA